MIHQPLWWTEWQEATDIKIAAEHILRTWNRLYSILAHHTWKCKKKLKKTGNEAIYDPEEALKYWLIDKIIKNKWKTHQLRCVFIIHQECFHSSYLQISAKVISS